MSKRNRAKRAEDCPEFVKRDECPACFYQIECATAAGGGENRPGPGDFSVCLNCAELLRYDDQLNLYIPSEDEMAELDSEAKALIDRARVIIVTKIRPMRNKIRIQPRDTLDL